MIDFSLLYQRSYGPGRSRTVRGRCRSGERNRRSVRPAIENLEGRALLSAGDLDRLSARAVK